MRLTGVLAAILLLSGCGEGPFRRVQAPPPPPGPTPVRIPDQVTSVEPAPPPENLPPPPVIASPRPDSKPGEAAVMSLPQTPTTKPPASPRPKRAATKKRAAPPPAPVRTEATEETASAAVTATPTYRLGELRSAEENEKLRRQGEQLIADCAKVLAAAEGRALTSMQAEMVNRVRGFAQQAREVMEKDPAEGRNLAAKGKTFADALSAELR